MVETDSGKPEDQFRHRFVHLGTVVAERLGTGGKMAVFRRTRAASGLCARTTVHGQYHQGRQKKTSLDECDPSWRPRSDARSDAGNGTNGLARTFARACALFLAGVVDRSARRLEALGRLESSLEKFET